MNSKLTLRTLAAGLVIAGLGVSGTALANDDTGRPAPAGNTHSTPVTVENQVGKVIEATGSADGLDVSLSLYENQKYGNSLQVVLGDPELDKIGTAEQTEPFVVDGQVDVTVQIDGRPARLTGSVAEIGTSKLVEPIQDAGEQLVTKSRQTQLSAVLTVTYDGVTVPLEAAPAFAYYNEVRRVALYGN